MTLTIDIKRRTSIVPPSTPRSSKPYVRDHHEAAFIVYYVSAVLMVYYWRFGSISQAFFMAVTCVCAAPNRFASRLLDALLEWPGRSVLDFKPLSQRTLKWATGPFGWFFPLKSQGFGHLDIKQPKVIFLANSHVVGADLPLLVSHISTETGLNVRAVIKSYHFKILGWKHALEFIGCVPDFPDTVNLLIETGSPILTYTDLDKGPLDNQLISKALKHGYTVIPISTVGCTDAFKVVATLSEKPLLDYFGLDTPSDASPLLPETPTLSPITEHEILSTPPKSPPASAIPVLAPFISPQTLYMRVGKAMSLDEGEEADEAAVTRVAEALESSLKEGVKRCREVQEKDPERFSTAAGMVLMRRRRRSSVFRRMKTL